MMLGLPNGTKIYFCSQPVDFRMGFDGLGGIVESVFEMNVLDGHLFLFVNRRRDRMKALWWEPGGLILWYKRLERGTFEIPPASEGQRHVTIDGTQLAMLIGGVPLASSRMRRKRMEAA
jgi:transposase